MSLLRALSTVGVEHLTVIHEQIYRLHLSERLHQLLLEREEVARVLRHVPPSRVSVGERVKKGAVRLPVVEQP